MFFDSPSLEAVSENDIALDKGAQPQHHEDVLGDVFDALYASYPFQVAKETSRKERKANQYISLTLVYGEIRFESFRVVIDSVKRWYRILGKPGGTFLDIGSGSGKAVFAATLAHDFDACFGIEILRGLYEISVDVAQQWEKRIKKQYPLSIQKKRTRIAFTHGDALEHEWPPNADIVFMNSTCFGEVLLRDLTRKLNGYCKPGTIVISATHPLPTDVQNGFEVLTCMKVAQDTWGDATWFIQRKT
ncbi:TPA: hypothetical protein N0F65_001610 [Lagenidium giganteum]|uniref:Histone-lysine N-methyltransferase, H3 lysine-79 specific n=1 Tax=Lagenidium giganteum TaxID=4803 RepID=A0AAV2Z4N6_9STRA|nr:TPA: hypothetical protein N0F65_001610 [Lagenidium giganteum]